MFNVLLGIEVLHHLEFSQQYLYILLLIVTVQVRNDLFVDLILQLHNIAFSQTDRSMCIDCLLVDYKRMKL